MFPRVGASGQFESLRPGGSEQSGWHPGAVVVSCIQSRKSCRLLSRTALYRKNVHFNCRVPCQGAHTLQPPAPFMIAPTRSHCVIGVAVFGPTVPRVRPHSALGWGGVVASGCPFLRGAPPLWACVQFPVSQRGRYTCAASAGSLRHRPQSLRAHQGVVRFSGAYKFSAHRRRCPAVLQVSSNRSSCGLIFFDRNFKNSSSERWKSVHGPETRTLRARTGRRSHVPVCA